MRAHALYSERAGKRSPARNFSGACSSPARRIPTARSWLDVSRETMLSAARAIGQAVRQASATARVGLMSSVPHVHAAEGRDWHALASRAGGRPAARGPHPPAGLSGTGPPARYLAGLNRVALLNRAFLPTETEVYPELENFPYSLFSKSRRFTRFQLLSALVLNLAGITIDLYDLNGNGIVWEDGYQDMIRDVKPFLNRPDRPGRVRGRTAGRACAVQPGLVLYPAHHARRFHGGALPPRDVLCSAAARPGHSRRLLPEPGSQRAGGGRLGSGAAQLGYGNPEPPVCAQLRHSGRRRAVDAIGRGGLAIWRGWKARWLTQDSRACAYEQAEEGARLRRTDRRAPASAMIFCSDVLDVRYLPDARVEGAYRVYDSFRRHAARADGGERTGDDLSLSVISAWGCRPMLLGHAAGRFLQDVLDAAGFSVPMVRGLAYLAPYCFRSGDTTALYPQSTPAPTRREDVVLSLPGRRPRPPVGGTRAHMLAPGPPKGGAALGAGSSLETALILFDDTQRELAKDDESDDRGPQMGGGMV